MLHCDDQKCKLILLDIKIRMMFSLYNIQITMGYHGEFCVYLFESNIDIHQAETILL